MCPLCVAKKKARYEEMTRMALKVIKSVSDRHGLAPRTVVSRCREREVITARHEVWTELRSRGWLLREIAHFFGVHHSTVIHALKRSLD